MISKSALAKISFLLEDNRGMDKSDLEKLGEIVVKDAKNLVGEELLELFKFVVQEYSFDNLMSEMNDMKDISVDYLMNFFEDSEEYENIQKFFESVGPIKNVESVETTSGTAYYILHFQTPDVYIKINGYWNSYENYADFSEEYDSLGYSVVKPKEKTITVYE